MRVGPLPHLLEVAAAAARRPAYVVVLADRDGADIVTHASGDQAPGEPFPVGRRPGAQHDPHPRRPPGQLHGERHLTDREPESGGQPNAEFIAGRVSQAADSVGAHIVLGAGDQHILDAVAGHLPDSLGPVTTIAGGREPDGRDDSPRRRDRRRPRRDHRRGHQRRRGPGCRARRGAGPGRGSRHRGRRRAAGRAAGRRAPGGGSDVARDAQPGVSYRIGSRPTEFLVGESDAGTEVPLADGLVWAALHQDAIIVQLPDRAGPLAGEPAAALLRRGPAAVAAPPGFPVRVIGASGHAHPRLAAMRSAIGPAMLGLEDHSQRWSGGGQPGVECGEAATDARPGRGNAPADRAGHGAVHGGA